ncbi:hypothetical protein CC79DRAFT_565646 [Sarocladium strictum]
MTSLTLSVHAVTQGKKIITSLTTILAKAASSPKAESLPEARLIEDMLPLKFQVTMVADNVSKGVARAQGVEPPKVNWDMKTIADMQTQLKQTLEYVEAADVETINKREEEIVTLGLGKGKPDGKMKAIDYVLGYSAPNAWFHLNAAYCILRKEGVEIGKMDYLNAFTEGLVTIPEA